MTPKKEDSIRQVLSSHKLKPRENLKYRIMHQIEMEAVFSKSLRKKEKKIESQINYWSTILVTMATIFIATVFAFYFLVGEKFYQQKEFLYTILFITIVSTAFGSIILFDEKRRNKHISKK